PPASNVPRRRPGPPATPRRSRLAAPRRPREHQRGDEREKTEGPRADRHGHGEAGDRDGLPARSPGDPRHLERAIGHQDGQETRETPTPPPHPHEEPGKHQDEQRTDDEPRPP